MTCGQAGSCLARRGANSAVAWKGCAIMLNDNNISCPSCAAHNLARVRCSSRFLQQSSTAPRVANDRMPVTALVLATMLPAGVRMRRHEASRQSHVHQATASRPTTLRLPVARWHRYPKRACSNQTGRSEQALRRGREPRPEQLMERWAKFKAADRTMCRAPRAPVRSVQPTPN